jgi:NodT family efflux transporter outer membrane factor (OMF) lipoprotein
VLVGRRAELEGWWRRMDDPVLEQLVERALRGGLDLREALARVREARALRGVAAGERAPRLDAISSYTRTETSDETAFGGFPFDEDLYALGFDATWEVDLWGRVQRSLEAADAELDSSYEDARDVAVTVAAEVARQYVALRGFQTRLAIARNNVELQEQTLEIVRARFEAGLVEERDLAQAMSGVETTRARLPVLEIGARAAEHRLAVLLGELPGSLTELARALPVPVVPAEVAVGVPADLLRRRADVRRAERRVAAEHARIGVAEGDLYPRLALSGNLGLRAGEIDDLLRGDSFEFGIGPSLRWNLFDGGRLRARVEAQDARAEQALVRWERAVLVAFEECENAMTVFLSEQARRSALRAAAELARRSVELARTQYGEGLSDFQVVLSSERALVELEDQLAESETSIAIGLVALYKALGGGWEPLAATDAAATRLQRSESPGDAR